MKNFVYVCFYKHDKSSIYEENAIHYPFNGRSVYDSFCCKSAGTLAGISAGREIHTRKLNTMLFSTVVDPHWFQKGNNFWFEYKTSEGTFWYVVDPAARTRSFCLIGMN